MSTSTISTAATTASVASSLTARPRQRSTAAPAPLIVRALFDYHSPDPTNLSFRAGTLIRVLTQLQSGWWDGCIDGERGWFPCNFVAEVDADTLTEEEDFLDTNDSSVSSGDEDDGERVLEGDELGEEFTWVPQADKEGRTYYLNTANGTTSWELPGAKLFTDDWEEPEEPRSSMESENSEDILMLGPTQPELAFKEFHVLTSFYCIGCTDHSVFPFIQLHRDIHLTRKRTLGDRQNESR